MPELPYKEVMQFILETRDFDRQVDNLVKGWALNLAKMSKATKDAKPLDEVEKEIKHAIKSMQQMSDDWQKNLDKMEREALAADMRRIKAVNARNQAESVARERAIKSKEAAEAKAEKEALAADMRRVKAVNARNEAEAAAKQRAAKAIEAAEAREEREYLAREQRKIRAVNARHEAEMKAAKAQAEGWRGNIGLGGVGRIGAGLAVAGGQYRMGGAMYAASNVLDTATGGASLAELGIGGGAIAAGGMVLGAAAGATAMLMHGRELNIELAKMSTLLAPASTGMAELHGMMSAAADSAARLSERFNTNIVDVVKAFKEALSSGIEANDLERFGMTAGVLAKALGEDFGKTVNILTNFKDTYNLTVTDLTKVNDILFNVVDKGKVNASQMINNLGRLLPTASSAKIALEDLAGAFATLTRGMTVPQATTSLNRVITDILEPSEKAKKAFNDLGIMYGEAAFQGRTLVEIIQDIKDKTGGKGDVIGMLFPEIQAQRGVAFLTQTTGLMTDITKSMKELNGEASGAAARAQDTFWENLGRKIEGVNNKIKIVGSSFADALNVAGKFYGIFDNPDVLDAKKLQMKKLFEAGYNFTTDKAGNATVNDDTGRLKSLGITQEEYGKFILEQFNKESQAKADEREKLLKYEGTSGIARTELSAEKEKLDTLKEANRQREIGLRITQEERDTVLDLQRAIEAAERRNLEERVAFKESRFSAISSKSDAIAALKAKEIASPGSVTKELSALIDETEALKKQSLKEIFDRENLTPDYLKAARDNLKAFEEEILGHKTLAEVSREEAAKKKASSEAEHDAKFDLAMSIREQKHQIDLEIASLRAQKAGMKDYKKGGIDRSADRAAIDATIAALQQKKYDLDTDKMMGTEAIRDSFSAPSTTTSIDNELNTRMAMRLMGQGYGLGSLSELREGGYTSDQIRRIYKSSSMGKDVAGRFTSDPQRQEYEEYLKLVDELAGAKEAERKKEIEAERAKNEEIKAIQKDALSTMEANFVFYTSNVIQMWAQMSSAAMSYMSMLGAVPNTNITNNMPVNVQIMNQGQRTDFNALSRSISNQIRKEIDNGNNVYTVDNLQFTQPPTPSANG